MAVILKLISRETLLKIINVILRVPAIFIVEIWLRTDPKTVTIPILLNRSSDGIVDRAIQSTGTHDFVVQALYYSVMALAIFLAFLPLRKLVQLYMYLVSGALLIGANYCSNLYVDEEKSSKIKGSVLEDKESLQRAGVHIAVQVIVSATVAYLLSMNKWTLFLFAAYILPVVARMVNYPVEYLHKVHNFATLLDIFIVTYFLFNVVPKVLDSVKVYAQQVSVLVQLAGWMPFVMAIWINMALSAQFLLFWLVLFAAQMYRYLRLHDHANTIEGYIVMVLTCMAECCVTPVTLFGLCVAISYLAFGLLTLTRIFLLGRAALTAPETVTQRGYSEGFTMFLLALQTGLLELKTTQKAFLLCIVLFIVVSSLIQSMFDITDPILLSLGAGQNRSVAKHFRAVLLSTFLWMFPLYMAWMISLFFDMDFWLMVVISSCILTSVQVVGSLVTYSLFMYDSFAQTSLENLDDFVFYAKATTRVLEFVVAVFVVCYGVYESLFGTWSWLNAAILIVHCYFNVWQRLQVGWKSYLLRREASAKVGSLRDATESELEMLNDVCCICYQAMSHAKITHCQHYFHAVCLRKWLYVQENCPMCHQTITSITNTAEDNDVPDGTQNNDASNFAQNVGDTNVEGDINDTNTSHSEANGAQTSSINTENFTENAHNSEEVKSACQKEANVNRTENDDADNHQPFSHRTSHTLLSTDGEKLVKSCINTERSADCKMSDDSNPTCDDAQTQSASQHKTKANNAIGDA